MMLNVPENESVHGSSGRNSRTTPLRFFLVVFFSVGFFFVAISMRSPRPLTVEIRCGFPEPTVALLLFH